MPLLFNPLSSSEQGFFSTYLSFVALSFLPAFSFYLANKKVYTVINQFSHKPLLSPFVNITIGRGLFIELANKKGR